MHMHTLDMAVAELNFQPKCFLKLLLVTLSKYMTMTTGFNVCNFRLYEFEAFCKQLG